MMTTAPVMHCRSLGSPCSGIAYVIRLASKRSDACILAKPVHFDFTILIQPGRMMRTLVCIDFVPVVLLVYRIRTRSRMGAGTTIGVRLADGWSAGTPGNNCIPLRPIFGKPFHTMIVARRATCLVDTRATSTTSVGLSVT